MKNRNLITIHYDGPITADHRLSLRTLGVTLTHMQAAIDRAYIELKYGRVVKHARLKHSDYALVDFTVGQPRDGGFIVDLLNKSTFGIADRIYTAVNGAYEKAAKEGLAPAESINRQAERRTEAYKTGVQPAQTHEKFNSTQQTKSAIAKFGDRAITKELDQILSQIRVDRYEGSTLELTIAGTNSHAPIVFDKTMAERFHRVVSARTLGDPVQLSIQIRALDAGKGSTSPTGKATNMESKRDFVLHFGSDDDFNQLMPFFRAGAKRPVISIIACPVLEYKVFDSAAGDMFFIAAPHA